MAEPFTHEDYLALRQQNRGTQAQLEALLESVGEQRDKNGDKVTLAVLGERMDATNKHLSDIVQTCVDLKDITARQNGRTIRLETWRDDVVTPSLKKATDERKETSDTLRNFRLKAVAFGLTGGGVLASVIELIKTVGGNS